MAGGAVLAAVGIGLLYISPPGERDDDPATVVGAMFAVNGLALCVVGVIKSIETKQNCPPSPPEIPG